MGSSVTLKLRILQNTGWIQSFFEIPDYTAEEVNKAIESKKKIIAVGTSVARVLEANTTAGRFIRSGKGWTDKFIHCTQTLKVVNNR